MRVKKISIIVVCLITRVSFIKTIESIRSQINQNYEIIVIDGGSIDGTVKEIIKMKSFFSFYSIKKDNGIYDAMNKGIDQIQSDWAMFLNSGDIFFDNRVLDRLINSKMPQSDIIFSNTVVKNDNLKYVVPSKQFNNNTITMPFCHQSTIVKTSLLKYHKFNVDYKFSSDFDFFLKCYKQNKIFFYFDNILSTVESGGISDNQRQKVYKENLRILNKARPSLLIYMLMLRQFLVSLVKFFVPIKLLKFILKLKYKNKIIK
mgnify:FL=1